jgi:hypothetical protein
MKQKITPRTLERSMATMYGLTPALFREENRAARLKVIESARASEQLEPPNESADLYHCIQVFDSLANRFTVDPNIQALGRNSLPQARHR